MKGSPKVVDLLQQAVKSELQAIQQYVLHSVIAENLGYAEQAQKTMGVAKVEMSHLDKFMERLTFLEAVPTVGIEVKIETSDVLYFLNDQDLNGEMRAVELYRKAIPACREAGDEESAQLFASILHDEEDHVNYLETEQRKLQALKHNYAALLTQE